MSTLDERIVVEVFRAASLLAGEGNRLAGTLGLTQQQWVLLAAVARAGPEGLPLSALGRSLLVTKANITGMVDRLERDGYVSREDHPSDRRVTRARLTQKGRRFLDAIGPLQEAWNRRAFGGFSRTDQASLLRLLERQVHALKRMETETLARRRSA